MATAVETHPVSECSVASARTPRKQRATSQAGSQPPSPDRTRLVRSPATLQRITIQTDSAPVKESKRKASGTSRPPHEEADPQILLTPAANSYTAFSTPASPTPSSPRAARHGRRSLSSPHPDPARSTPSRSSPPAHIPSVPKRPSTAEKKDSPSLLSVHAAARPSLSVEAERCKRSVTPSASTGSISKLAGGDESSVHIRTRSLTASASTGTGGWKMLARKASGRLRFLSNRPATPTEPLPPMPSSNDSPSMGAISGRSGNATQTPTSCEEDAGFGLAISTVDEVTPVATPQSAASPSTPPAANLCDSPKPTSQSPRRKRSISRTKSKSLPRSDSDADVERSSVRQTRRSHAEHQRAADEAPDANLMKRALGKKKSTGSLTSSSSLPSLFHLGRTPEPPPPPLITPFVIEVQEVPAPADGSTPASSPLTNTNTKLQWPPKRMSSMTTLRRPEDAAVPPTPPLSLASSLSTLSRLSAPMERDPSSESPRIRFPSSFGFVTAPLDDVPPLPEMPDLSTLKISSGPPARSEAARDAERAKKFADFEEMLSKGEDEVIRKTLTPALASRSKR